MSAPLVADGQPTKAAEPGQRTLHDPTMSPQVLAPRVAHPDGERAHGRGARLRAGDDDEPDLRRGLAADRLPVLDHRDVHARQLGCDHGDAGDAVVPPDLLHGR